MVTKTENKSWFRRHWILTIILIIFIIGAIGTIFDTDTKELSNTKNDITKEYTDDDLYTLHALFVDRNSPYTELQKEEKWKEYDNKWIKDSGIVKEIDEAFNPYVRILNPDNEFISLATIYFKESEKEKLLSIEKYEEINFEGRLEQYNSLLGVIIKDAELI